MFNIRSALTIYRLYKIIFFLPQSLNFNIFKIVRIQFSVSKNCKYFRNRQLCGFHILIKQIFISKQYQLRINLSHMIDNISAYHKIIIVHIIFRIAANQIQTIKSVKFICFAILFCPCDVFFYSLFLRFTFFFREITWCQCT